MESHRAGPACSLPVARGRTGDARRRRFTVQAAAYSRGRPQKRGGGLPPSDWLTPVQQQALERRRVVLSAPPTDVVPSAVYNTRGRSVPVLAIILELLDAGALLGAAGGAAAAIITEQLTFCLLPLTLPLVALLAGRAARGMRDAKAREELLQLKQQVESLPAQVRGAASAGAHFEAMGLFAALLHILLTPSPGRSSLVAEQLQGASFSGASIEGLTELQGLLQPLALLPEIDTRLNALEGTLTTASRGMAVAARDASVAAGALSRDASAAVAAAERVEQALRQRQGEIDDAMDQALDLASRAASERDAVLRATIVAEILQPLRALSMQVLSIAAATAGAAAAAGSNNSSKAQPAMPALQGAVKAELTDAQLESLVAAVGQKTRSVVSEAVDAAGPVRLAPEQWAALGRRLQRLEEAVAVATNAPSASATPADEKPVVMLDELRASSTSAALPQLSDGDRSIESWIEEPAGILEAVPAAPLINSMEASNGQASRAASEPPAGRPSSSTGGVDGTADSNGASTPLASTASSSRVDATALMRDGLAALRAGRADAEACARGEPDTDASELADERLDTAASLFAAAADAYERSGDSSGLAAAQGNCGNALLARARHAVFQENPQRLSLAEDWLMQAGRRFRAANEASGATADGRALTQWGASLALRGRLVAGTTPDDAQLLFDAAAEKFAAARTVSTQDTAPDALIGLGQVLLDKADTLRRGSYGRSAALKDAVAALEEAIRLEPEDEEALALLKLCDVALEEEGGDERESVRRTRASW